MIFITGGTGLVGSHLLFELVKKGKEVRALKRSSSNLDRVLQTFSHYSKDAKDLFNRIQWVDADLLDYYSLEPHLKGITEVYHCGAIVSFDPRERQKMIANNVEGTANLVNAAIQHKVKKFCHVSSISALGHKKDDQLIDEETSWVPGKRVSGYSESKFFSENEVWRGMEEGLDAVIVNPTIIFGPANWNTGSSKMFKSIWDGMKFYTKGVTGFVDVSDVVQLMMLLMEEKSFEKDKNKRFVINSENLSYKEVFNGIADALNKPRPGIFASDLLLSIVWRIVAFGSYITGKPSLITRDSVSNSNKNRRYDGSRIAVLFGYKYMPIAESIKRTAGFLRSEMGEK